MIIAATIR